MIPPDRAHPADALRACLHELFPADAAELLPLCCTAAGIPHGYTHARILADLVGGSPAAAAFADLRLGYVLLTSYYYLLDAVVDNHLAAPRHQLHLTHLLVGACHLLQRAFARTTPETAERAAGLVRRAVSQNGAAAAEELDTLFDPAAADDSYASVVGRLNPFLLLGELSALLGGKPLDERLHRALNDFAFFMQSCDDLADWREDFRGGRWNPVLRGIFRRCPEAAASEAAMEEALYLSGLYEQRVAAAVNGFRGVLAGLPNERGGGAMFRGWVESNILRLRRLLYGFLEAKMAECPLPKTDR